MKDAGNPTVAGQKMISKGTGGKDLPKQSKATPKGEKMTRGATKNVMLPKKEAPTVAGKKGSK